MKKCIVLLSFLITFPYFNQIWATNSEVNDCSIYKYDTGADFDTNYFGSVYKDIYQNGKLVKRIHLYDYESTYGSRFDENESAEQELEEALSLYCS